MLIQYKIVTSNLEPEPHNLWLKDSEKKVYRHLNGEWVPLNTTVEDLDLLETNLNNNIYIIEETLNNKILSIDTDISSVTNDVATLKSDITPLKTAVGSITDISSYITEYVEGAIDGIEFPTYSGTTDNVVISNRVISVPNYKSNNYVVNVGPNNTVTASIVSYQQSITIGASNTCSGEAVVIGSGNKGANTGVAIGEANSATGYYSIGIGHKTTVTGQGAIGIGDNNSITGLLAVSLGNVIKNSVPYAVALGYDYTVPTETAFSYGKYSVKLRLDSSYYNLWTAGDMWCGGTYSSPTYKLSNARMLTNNNFTSTIYNNDPDGDTQILMNYNSIQGVNDEDISFNIKHTEGYHLVDWTSGGTETSPAHKLSAKADKTYVDSLDVEIELYETQNIDLSASEYVNAITALMAAIDNKKKIHFIYKGEAGENEDSVRIDVLSYMHFRDTSEYTVVFIGLGGSTCVVTITENEDGTYSGLIESIID